MGATDGRGAFEAAQKIAHSMCCEEIQDWMALAEENENVVFLPAFGVTFLLRPRRRPYFLCPVMVCAHRCRTLP